MFDGGANESAKSKMSTPPNKRMKMEVEVPSLPGALPSELWKKILSKITTFRDIASLLRVNKDMAKLADKFCYGAIQKLQIAIDNHGYDVNEVSVSRSKMLADADGALWIVLPRIYPKLCNLAKLSIDAINCKSDHQMTQCLTI